MVIEAVGAVAVSAASAASAAWHQEMAALAAQAAGAPYVSALTSPTPVDGSRELLVIMAGVQFWQVVNDSWAFQGWIGEVLFDDVAALLASTLTGFVDGQVIRTRKEAFAYEVVTRGEHIETANGTKLKVIRKDGVFYASAFGLSAGMAAAEIDPMLEKIAAAVSTGDTVVFDVAGTIDVSSATFSAAGLKFIVQPLCHIRQANAALNAFAITVSGDNFKISGGGKISSHITELGDYATTGSGIARAILRITGDFPIVDGIEIATPSRCGIYLDGCESPTFINNWGDGGYLETDYNHSTTLNLYAVYYNPEGQTAVGGNVYTYAFNRFSNYITPQASGAFGAGGTFVHNGQSDAHHSCYDHGYYMLNGVGGHIHGHISSDTRIPAAIDMNGVDYAYAEHKWSSTTGSNMEAGLSFRNWRNGAKVHNFRLIGGRGGYIDVRPSTDTGVDLSEIEIYSFRLEPAAKSTALAPSIRVDDPTWQAIRAPIIRNFWIKSFADSGVGAITINGASGRPCIRPILRDGYIKLENIAFGLAGNWLDDLDCENVTIDRSGYDAESAATLDFVFMQNSNRPSFKGIKLVYQSGGANVTQRGINLQGTVANALIEGLQNLMTSGSLVANTPISDSGSGTIKRCNRYDMSAALTGKVTLPSGVASVIVNNGNVRVGSKIFITPANAGAAQQQSNTTHQSVYASEEAASARFRLLTGSGGATSVAGDWFWEIKG